MVKNKARPHQRASHLIIHAWKHQLLLQYRFPHITRQKAQSLIKNQTEARAYFHAQVHQRKRLRRQGTVDKTWCLDLRWRIYRRSEIHLECQVLAVLGALVHEIVQTQVQTQVQAQTLAWFLDLTEHARTQMFEELGRREVS